MTLPPAPWTAFSYDHVGATREGPLPCGYAHLRERTYLGRGVLEQAGELLLTWRMHRGVGLTVRAAAQRAAPGVDVVSILGIGPVGVAAPCRVVWTVIEERRVGFAYGTLVGHPETGEESFLVEQDEEGHTYLTVTSFSRPAAWYARLGGPLVRLAQRMFARRCGRVLRRMCNSRSPS